MTPYQSAKDDRDKIAKEYRFACLETIAAFRKKHDSIPPISPKETPEWLAAWENERRLFRALCGADAYLKDAFHVEIKAERDARLASRIAARMNQIEEKTK